VLAELLAGADAVVAAPEPARPFLLAGLAAFSTTSTILVVTPTAADAEHLAHDLAAFIADRPVELFPAWETLPFERVSPAVETMGERLRVIAALAGGAPGTTPGADPIVIAPVKAVLQRLATTGEAAVPVVIRRGQEIALDKLIAWLVAAGYRREYQVEHRGELAVRGGILDVYPSTADLPVRIDCFGDEVDRLSSFDLVDQRSLADLESVEIFGCREMTPTPAVAELAGRLAGSASFGRG
jgi:transcription-repair coupling factor (superfamily II helicase)